MPRIYISHRPEDSSYDEVEVIRERLVKAFGTDNVFDSTSPHIDTKLERQAMVASCDMLIVVVGQYWLSGIGENHDNIQDNTSYLEISTGLNKGVLINLMAVDGAPLPKVDQLPSALQPLLNERIIVADDDVQLKNELDELIIEWEVMTPTTQANDRNNVITPSVQSSVSNKSNISRHTSYQMQTSQSRTRLTPEDWGCSIIALIPLIVIFLFCGLTIGFDTTLSFFLTIIKLFVNAS